MNINIEHIINQKIDIDKEKEKVINDNLKSILVNIDKKEFDKIRKMIEDSNILSFNPSFYEIDYGLDPLSWSGSIRKTKTITINDFVSESYWDEIKIETVIFIDSITKLRSLAFFTIQQLYNSLDRNLQELRLNFLEEIIAGLVKLSNINVGQEQSELLTSWIDAAVRGTYTLHDFLENQLYPWLNSLFDSLKIDDEKEVVYYLNKAVFLRENIFEVLAIQQKALDLFINMPWYKRTLLDGAIVFPLYKHIERTKLEILKATKLYNEAILEKINKKYDEEFGGY
ncbi:hypothetical protein FRW55_02465 [Mycoplasma anserisalpingitidis]|uniref:Uncharacterized protein n=1 Tax=Mycoplasma anserisalpingitidis TaxID=519450 RepID=A0A5B8J7G3_9MOLU|nr:hypothetical protein [Mycoplasma anserisalpingitidis]QDY87012.1 hypothetical protein FRW55_02465 [Mycoplasma anserisalpingitidis]